jgi:hypothetical protein
MPLILRLKANNAPPGQQCLTTLQAVLQAVAQYMSVVGPDGLSGIVISATEPSTDDRDKAWLKLEANGKPIGLFKYQDAWLQVPGVHQGAIILYTGLVSAIPAGWVLANGLNGAPDLTDNTNYASLWQPNYTALGTTYDLCPIWFKGFAT